MSKRLLFIEDLYNFYSTKYNSSTHFNANETGEPLVVQVRGKINFDKSDKDTEGLCPVHLQACHTNLNLNGSNIEESVMTAALPSFSNRPILGYIHKVNGQYEFYSHNMHEDEDGNIIYDEVPIGVIPESCNAQLVYDKEKDKTYCEVDGYIFEEYSKASEILQREGECFVSVELSIRELSYNANKKYLNIEDFWFSGVTILGKTPDGETIMPGMENSNIKLADFSEKNNSLFAKYENQLIEFQARLEKLESTCINTYYPKEGGNQPNMKFEELLEKYGKVAEDITFDYSGMSDEDLEAEFKKLFEEDQPSNEEGEGEVDPEPETDPETDPEVEPETEPEVSDPEPQQFEKIIRKYEISHEDIRWALYTLLEEFEVADNEWYFINSVYDTYFTYENWDGDKIFGQAYAKDGDNVTFDGERYTLHRELLTDSEYAELQSIRANYSELKEFKENFEKNELRIQKETIANSDKYAVICGKDEEGKYTNEAFSKLMDEIDTYSLADFETQIKVIHSDFIAENSTFAEKPEEKKPATSVKVFTDVNGKTKKSSRYGNLFKNKNN